MNAKEEAPALPLRKLSGSCPGDPILTKTFQERIEALAQRSKNRDLVNLIQRELRNRWVSEEFIEDLETEIDTVDDRQGYSEEMAKRVGAN